MSKVYVANNEPVVHCIDIANGLGERIIRIRPHPVSGGMSLEVRDGPAVVLNFDELDELLGALCRIQVKQQRELEQLRDANR